MTNAIADYLPHFLVGARDGLARGIRPLGGGTHDAQERDPIAEATARGREAGLAAAKADFDRQRAEDIADFEMRLAEKEEYLRQEIAIALASGVADGLARIEGAISDQVGRAVARFLDRAVRERAIAELAQTLKALLADGSAVRVSVTAPEALVDRLRERLALPAIEILPGAHAEVTVTVDDTLVETRIGAWARLLSEPADGGPDV